jgi:ferredoxin-type protein NapF
MKQKKLKLLRLFISLVFLVAIAAVFVDFREMIPVKWTDSILFLQFVPSVIKFITVPALVAAGFIFIILLTALFGRAYCSAICPLGILQDLFSWIAKRTRLIKRYKFSKALDYLRYPFLAIVIILVITGSLFLVNLLDPYSSFGRIFSDIIRPGVVFLNNGLAGLLEKVNVYFLFRMNLDLITWRVVFIPACTLVLIIWLSLYFGRLYCNTVCPVGTTLGLLSRVSLFKIKMDEATCTKCGKCSMVCKSTCINVKSLHVDFSRCVACYNCISVCSEGSIKYERSFKKEVQPWPADISKRDFIGKTLVYGAALAGFSKTVLGQVTAERPAGRIANKKNFPVSPPGSMSLKHFHDRCTACHLCVSACPTGVLQPSFLEYGFTGMMQPRMDYAVEYCNFECTQCSEVCPTGAILPITVEDKKLEQLGRVIFIMEKCIVYTDNTACGSCAEHCPTQAVKMVSYKNGLTIPQTDTEICIGCGACEFACPVKPNTAIYIDGNEVHGVAKAPKVEDLHEESTGAFPF